MRIKYNIWQFEINFVFTLLNQSCEIWWPKLRFVQGKIARRYIQGYTFILCPEPAVAYERCRW